MIMEMFIPVIYNGALLTLLVLVLEIFQRGRLGKVIQSRIITGLMLGFIGVAVMANPWQAVEGVVFDTRSILLSTGALFFGLIPALIAVVLTIFYRVSEGGAGVLMGIGVIISSTAVGILWRKWRGGKLSDISLLELLTFGLVVHSIMLVMTLALPSEITLRVLSLIALPVLTVYPMVTLALGFLLVRSQRRTEFISRLQESEGRYRLLADNTLDAIWLMDLEARFLYLNPSVKKLLGHDPGEMTGRGLWEFCDEKNFRIMKEQIDNVLSSLPDLKEVFFEAVMIRKDGSEINVEITGRVVLGEDGRPTSLQGVTRDITERKQAETERERLRLAVEHTAESVIITDTAGKILYVNPAFEKTTGYRKQEVLGKEVSLLESGYHSRDFFDDVWKTLRNGQTWTGRFFNRKKDGTVFTEEVSISPVFSPAGEIINFIFTQRDVTYQTELEQQLLQSQKMEAVGQLAGGIAHDFNNILQAMMGYCEILRETIDEEGESSEFVDEIKKGAEKAAALTRQLLTFSRREEIRPKDLDLNEVIRDMLKLVGRTIGEQIEIVTRFYDGELPINGDPGSIEQVLMNLCVNARDAMPDGGKLILETSLIHSKRRYDSAHSTMEEGYYAVLTITDTGCGIEPALQSQIFEPFFTTKEVGKGTGLGLATAYAIVNQHSGYISVESEKDKGSTFSVYLPLAEADLAEKAAEALAPALEGGKETILLAEDNPEVRRLANLILQNAGYSVIQAADGEKAIDRIRDKSSEIDLAVIDVVMPKRSGKEVLEYYRRIRPSGKVLLVSGYSVGDMDVSNFSGKQVSFISKPFGSESLLRAVRKLLDG